MQIVYRNIRFQCKGLIAACAGAGECTAIFHSRP